MTEFVITPPAQVTLPVRNTDGLFPVRRVYCIGRNYADHAIEMGHDPDREPPFFFQKNASNLTSNGIFTYPTQSNDVHHEIEMAVMLGAGGRNVAASDALNLVYGYGVGLDLTCRDIQAGLKKVGRPWEIAKAFEESAPVSAISPVSVVGHLNEGAIRLKVNGVLRQSGDLNQMIWKIPEMISYLSEYFELGAGDVILTGTPAGVGPLVKGDVLEGTIDGLVPLKVNVV